MYWAIHRVSLASHDLAAARTFFEHHLGLGSARTIDERTLAFGQGSRGLRVHRPERALTKSGHGPTGPVSARHVALEIDDLSALAKRLDRAGVASVEADGHDFDQPALYTIDPAQNVIAFVERVAATSKSDRIQPWEAAWGWGIHHVNLQAGNVRNAVAFYVDVVGLTEGRWRAPESRGNFSIDPSELAVLALDDFNRGLHIIRADAGFAARNNFAHNPSIGGHPAFYVADVGAVKSRLEAAGTLVSDAGVYAMAGMRQIYMLDPSANMIEVNQFV